MSANAFTANDVIAARYRLINKIGEGGFGVVWRAQAQDSGTIVAVKFLTYAGPNAIRRFDIEADVLGRIAHPAILRPIDHGRTAHGVPFLVTEFVEGRTLAEWMDTLPDIDAARTVAAQLAEALHAAHTQGIVHRDLKPANVIIRHDSGRPCVLDFGIAKLVGRQTPDVTKTGEVLGTPGYMSPEQLLGRRDVDASTDVYALGVMLFEMFEQRAMHRGTSALEVAMMHLTEPVPELRRAPPQLAALVTEMLDREPERRPAAAVVARRLVEPSALRPAPDEPMAPAISSPHGRPELRALGVVVALAVLGAGVAIALWLDRPAPTQRLVTSEVKRPNPLAAADPDPSPDPSPDPVEVGPGHTSVADAGVDLGPPACPDLEPMRSGPHDATNSLGEGVWIHLPPGYSPRRRYPIVVFFHDFYQEPELARHNIDYDDPLTHDFVFIFPMGNPNNMARQQWRGDGRMERALASVAALSAVACVDQEQIFVIGHGRGGDAANYFRCHESPVAAATFGYRKTGKNFGCKATVPQIAIFPKHDAAAPFKGGTGCNDGKAIAVKKHVRGMRQLQQCSGEHIAFGDACWRHDCKIPFSHCEVPGPRRWRADYNDFVQLAGQFGRCGAPPPTRFPVTRTMFEFFDEIRSK